MPVKHDTIETDPAPKPRRTALSTPLLGIVLGVIGTVTMAISFVNGINAAYRGDGGADLYIALFIGGGVLAAIAVIIGLVGLFRGGHRFLSLLSLLIGLVPGAVIAAVRIANL